MGRPLSDDRRQRIDLRLPTAMLERIDQDLPDSQHANRTALIEAAVDRYLDELERAPIESAIARALALPRHEVNYVPEHYRENDLDAGAFRSWLAEIAPLPGPEWTPKQLANRHDVNPQTAISDRFLADDRLPEIATKRELLVLLARLGYGSEGRYWFDQQWRAFLKSDKAFAYTHK